MGNDWLIKPKEIKEIFKDDIKLAENIYSMLNINERNYWNKESEFRTIPVTHIIMKDHEKWNQNGTYPLQFKVSTVGFYICIF